MGLFGVNPSSFSLRFLSSSFLPSTTGYYTSKTLRNSAHTTRDRMESLVLYICTVRTCHDRDGGVSQHSDWMKRDLAVYDWFVIWFHHCRVVTMRCAVSRDLSRSFEIRSNPILLVLVVESLSRIPSAGSMELSGRQSKHGRQGTRNKMSRPLLTVNTSGNVPSSNMKSPTSKQRRTSHSKRWRWSSSSSFWSPQVAHSAFIPQ
jgi:hypothetical protein